MVTTFTALLLAAVWCADPAVSWKHPESEANGWAGTCRTGSEQSPIDIPTGDKSSTTPVNYEPLVFVNYGNLVSYNLTNNGHTAVLTAQNSCNVYLTGGGLRKLYKLEQMHFHWGSEHLVGGYRYPLELHFVHYDAKFESLQDAVGKNSSLAVLAVLFRPDKSDQPNKELAQVVSGLRAVVEPGKQAALAARLGPGSLLPPDTERWWRYAGSLTTPGCDQGVTWTVFKDTLPLGRDQVKEFQKLTQPAGAAGAAGAAGTEYILKNFRAPQPLKQRALLYQDPGQHAKCGAASSPASRGVVGAVLLIGVLRLLQVDFHRDSLSS